MPIYEYKCLQCAHRFNMLVGLSAQQSSLNCSKCGSSEVQRLMSRFCRGRNEDQRLDELSDRLEEVGEPDSPAQMRELMREMGKAMDDDASDEMEELFETDHDLGDSVTNE